MYVLMLLYDEDDNVTDALAVIPWNTTIHPLLNKCWKYIEHPIQKIEIGAHVGYTYSEPITKRLVRHEMEFTVVREFPGEHYSLGTAFWRFGSFHVTLMLEGYCTTGISADETRVFHQLCTKVGTGILLDSPNNWQYLFPYTDKRFVRPWLKRWIRTFK